MSNTAETDPVTVFETPERAVADMFANQAAWLELTAGGNIWPHDAASASVGDLLLSGPRAVAIARPEPDRLDSALAWLRKTSPGSILIWAARPHSAADLALHARGACESFRPRWMWHDLMYDQPPPALEGIEISLAIGPERDAYAAATRIPYNAPGDADVLFDLATTSDPERRVWLVLARLVDGSVSGAGFLHVTPLENRLTGAIYNLGVDPAWRRRRIGSALTNRLLRQARALGASGVALNATPDGERLYRRLGFVDVGEGATWHLPGDATRLPLSPATIAAAETLGRGETGGLDPALARWRVMPDGESPIRFAARFGQRASIVWLVEHGAELDIVPLWTSGFQDMAMGAMQDPRWIDARRGPEATTPLHDAVRLDDIALVRALLACGANLTIRDGQWRATPLQWARALGRSEIVPLLERAESL